MSKKQAPVRSSKELLHELQALVSEAQTLMAGTVSEQSTEAMDTLRARLEAVQESISENYDKAKAKVVDGAKATDATIREHPYQSIAIAAGIGLLLGVLLARRGH